MLKVVFLGTPDFAVPSLKSLIALPHRVELVLTQPDRPKGRHLHIASPPVKQVAQEEGIRIIQPEKINSQEVKGILEEIKPDVVTVVAYGEILPAWLLKFPKYGCVNVHPSLLPKYRGPAPIVWAVMEGEKETGVTVQRMDEGLDTGNILKQVKINIEADDTRGTLESKLAKLGAEILVSTLDELEEEDIAAVPQNEEEATYAKKLEKDEFEINWQLDTERIIDLVRALNPYPGAHTLYEGKRLKVWRVSQSQAQVEITDAEVGTIVGFDKKNPVIKTGDGLIVLLEVQPEGKRKMSAAEFSHGYQPQTGEKLS